MIQDLLFLPVAVVEAGPPVVAEAVLLPVVAKAGLLPVVAEAGLLPVVEVLIVDRKEWVSQSYTYLCTHMHE